MGHSSCLEAFCLLQRTAPPSAYVARVHPVQPICVTGAAAEETVVSPAGAYASIMIFRNSFLRFKHTHHLFRRTLSMRRKNIWIRDPLFYLPL